MRERPEEFSLERLQFRRWLSASPAGVPRSWIAEPVPARRPRCSQMFASPIWRWKSARAISARGLVARAAQQQRTARVVHTLGELLEGPQAGRVERGHVSKAQDHDLRQRVDVDRGRDAACRSRRTEKVHECGRSSRTTESSCSAGCARALSHVVVGHRAHRRRIRDALDKQQRGAHHADADGLVRSAKTVSANVTTQTATSVFVSRRSSGISAQSPML